MSIVAWTRTKSKGLLNPSGTEPNVRFLKFCSWAERKNNRDGQLSCRNPAVDAVIISSSYNSVNYFHNPNHVMKNAGRVGRLSPANVVD